MHDRELSWRFVEEHVAEPDNIAAQRTHSLELGVEPVSKATGAHLAFVSAAIGAQSIVEIGTGVGVSGLWLLAGSPDAALTSIDSEPDYQQVAKVAFSAADIPANHVRLIAGRALKVLPRINEASYDLVFIDADPAEVIEYVEHGLRMVRPGGTVLIAHALANGHVADPGFRDETVSAYRTLLKELEDSPAVVKSLALCGDGLLQIVRVG
jgi:predicted O-methyltransferase YrrM